MGIIVTDTLTLPNGISVTNYYVNVDYIKISKSNVESFKYSVQFIYNIYASHDARTTGMQIIQTHQCTLTLDTLDDLLSQIYSTLKNKFEEYQDVFEELTDVDSPISTTV